MLQFFEGTLFRCLTSSSKEAKISTFTVSVFVLVFFWVQWFEARGSCLFCGYWTNCWHYCLVFPFMKLFRIYLKYFFLLRNSILTENFVRLFPGRSLSVELSEFSYPTKLWDTKDMLNNQQKLQVIFIQLILVCLFVWWSLTPLSTIFQFYWWRKPEDQEKNHWPVASHWQTLSHNVVHLALFSGDRHWLHR